MFKTVIVARVFLPPSPQAQEDPSSPHQLTRNTQKICPSPLSRKDKKRLSGSQCVRETGAAISGCSLLMGAIPGVFRPGRHAVTSKFPSLLPTCKRMNREKKSLHIPSNVETANLCPRWRPTVSDETQAQTTYPKSWDVRAAVSNKVAPVPPVQL